MEEEILNYLHPDKVQLKVLNNKYKKYYSGVTLPYITYYLLKAKYRKSKVAEILLKLHQEKKIRSLFCPDIQQYVFNSKKCGYWNFDPTTGGTTGYGERKNIHIYLKQFIKTNE